MEPPRPRLVVADPDPSVLALVGRLALSEGFDLATAPDPAAPLPQLRALPTDLALLDLQAAGAPGLDLIRAVRDLSPDTLVIGMTAAPSGAEAIEAVKLGAADYLPKPIDAQRLAQHLRQARFAREQRRALLELESRIARELDFEGLVGRSARMQALFSLVRRVAPHTPAALIVGERGTGKDLVARALHAHTNRPDAPFVRLEGSRVESWEERGRGGTLCVEHVDTVSDEGQGRLLLLMGRWTVVATTSRDLEAAVGAGTFCPELFRRLRIVELQVPPLRQRLEDLPYLAAVFVRGCAERCAKPVIGLTAGAERVLATAVWDGNVAQLRQALERACMRADHDLITEPGLTATLRELGVATAAGAPTATIPAAADAAAPQREQILRTLQHVGGNKAVAARMLGISRRAFYRQLERLGLHQRGAAAARLTEAPVYDLEHL